MSRAQFAAIMLLTASAVGVGVGWLPRWFSAGERPEAPPQAAVVPVIVQQPSDQHDRGDEVKHLIAAFRKEIKTASAARESKQPEASAVKQSVLYQGKPASVWMAQLRDRDPEYRRNAVEPLLAIAEVDRSVIPALVDGLNDKDVEVQQKIADTWMS